MSNSTLSEVWGSLLSKLAVVPFAFLLIAILISQTASLKDQAESTEPARATETGVFTSDTFY